MVLEYMVADVDVQKTLRFGLALIGPDGALPSAVLVKLNSGLSKYICDKSNSYIIRQLEKELARIQQIVDWQAQMVALGAGAAIKETN